MPSWQQSSWTRTRNKGMTDVNCILRYLLWLLGWWPFERGSVCFLRFLRCLLHRFRRRAGQAAKAGKEWEEAGESHHQGDHWGWQVLREEASQIMITFSITITDRHVHQNKTYHEEGHDKGAKHGDKGRNEALEAAKTSETKRRHPSTNSSTKTASGSFHSFLI